MTSTTMISAPTQHVVAPLYWRLKDLPTLTGLSLRTVNRLRATGRLPKPDAKFGRAICFRPSTIERWAESGGLCQQSPKTN
jgi:predicted DNA-binding transcriptional regulator AlpA